MLIAKTWILVLALASGDYAEHPERLSREDCKASALNITMAIEAGLIPIFDDGTEIKFAFCHQREREIKA